MTKNEDSNTRRSSSHFRRRLYLIGRKMFFIPIISFISFSLTCSIGGAGFYGVFLQDWKYKSFSLPEMFVNILFYALCIALVSGVLSIILKAGAVLLGLIMQLFGTPDKIELERFNNGITANVKISNGEGEKFSGELKILRINDEELINPLLMGVSRGANIDPKISIPKGESVGVGIGFFDKKLKQAYFLDAYNQKILLPDQTRIYSKLSGNLENGEEIIKEKEWFLRYENTDNGTELSLSHLLEIRRHFLYAGNLKSLARLTAHVKRN